MQKNVFDLSHSKTFSMDMGELVPFLCAEIVPGDVFDCNSELLVRMSPLVAPVMHEIDVYTHYYFVPYRMLMDDWEDFITGGVDGDDTTVWPYMSAPATVGYLKGTLADYLGLPTDVADYEHSAFPFRAYDLIWNEWYRDQNKQGELEISKDSGEDTTTPVDLKKRLWEKDYFTSALPWPQRGDDVVMPLGTEAEIKLYSGAQAPMNIKRADTGADASDTQPHVKNAELTNASENVSFNIDPQGSLYADLTTATSSTIREIREAFQLQKFMEKMARGGARYVEVLLEHFGVRSSDARLQRPEYLGGGKSPVVISEVLSTVDTSELGGDQALGTMGGHSMSLQRSHGFRKQFEEHGIIIGLISIMPRTMYSQGLSRMWTRQNRYDYYWPTFANIGDQAILNKELYVEHTSPDGVFGYAPRFDELRKIESSVHAEFKGDLNYWHLGRSFDSDPSLSSEFLECDATKRCFAVTDQDTCWIQARHNIKAVRPLPRFGEPGIQSL